MKPIVPIYYDYRSQYVYLLTMTCPFEKLEERFDVVFEWRPFELRAEGAELPPPDFFKRQAPMRSWNYFQQVAKSHNLPVQPERPPFRYARLALEAAQYARLVGAFWPFHQALCKATHERHEDYNSVEVLCRLAAEVGIDAEGMRACLEERSFSGYVVQSREVGLAQGVFGVPTIVAGGRRVWGRAPNDELEEVLAEFRGK